MFVEGTYHMLLNLEDGTKNEYSNDNSNWYWM